MYASIIIPAYNSCERLYYNLLTLNAQDCARDRFEVIIVNNGSADGTSNMLSRFQSNFRLKAIHLEKNLGRSKSRNIAIREAEGEILIFHDSDMLASKDYISKHIEAHKKGSRVVCGISWVKIFSYFYKSFNSEQREMLSTKRNLYRLKKDFLHLSNKHPLLSAQQITNESYKNFCVNNQWNYMNYIISRYGVRLEGYSFPWEFFVTNNCSARKEDVMSVGLFDEAFVGWGCEDTDLGFRLYERGCSFALGSDILSVHQEHPIISSDKSLVVANRDRLLAKYDSINLIFFFLHRAICEDHNINELMKEMDILKASSLYADLTDLFLELLKALRARVLNIEHQLPSIPSMELLGLRVEEASRSLGLEYFKATLSALLKQLYGMSL